MAAIPRGAPQVLDLSGDPAPITLFDSPDPNAQVTLVFSNGDGDCELHAAFGLDGAVIYIPDTTHGGTIHASPFSVGPFHLLAAPRWVAAGGGSATEVTVQVLQITG